MALTIAPLCYSDVAYKPEGELTEVVHASLYVQIVGSELSAWKFYLEGHPS